MANSYAQRSLEGLVGRQIDFAWSDGFRGVFMELDRCAGKPALKKLNVGFSKDIDSALDAYCAQLSWQDTHPSMPSNLMTFDEMRDSFFPHFERWISHLVGQKGVSLPVTKHRIVAAVIGAAYPGQVDPARLNEQQWTNIVEFIRKPSEIAKTLKCEWPMSKGRWDGPKGYRAQMDAAHTIIAKITQ
jgi:hypothetical protein